MSMTATPKVSIFIRSYRGDREWLTYCLQALAKRATGFHEVVIALPVGDEPHFINYDFRGHAVHWVHDIAADGYMGQQVCKLEADLYCTGDVILYVDSDCILKRSFNADEMFVNGRIRQLLRFWKDAGTGHIWEPFVSAALGFSARFECMATHPMAYWRDSIKHCREYLNGLHGSMREYVRTRERREFSEFNVLGNFCHMFEPYRYDWTIADPHTDNYPRPFKQFWSWEGLAKNLNEVQQILQ